MTHRFHPIISHTLTGTQSPWNGFKVDAIDLCRIRNITMRERVFCLTDKYLPYTLDIDYYAGTTKLVYTGHIWTWVPKEYETISFRYPSKHDAENECKLIHRRLNLIDEMYKHTYALKHTEASQHTYVLKHKK